MRVPVSAIISHMLLTAGNLFSRVMPLLIEGFRYAG